MRHKKEIESRHLTQRINRKAQSQIIALLEKYISTYTETHETGWQYDISTSECVFRDVSQFYPPKHYDTNDKYVEVNDINQFISTTTSFVFLMLLNFMKIQC